MLLKNHPIILFIDRNGFSVYQDVLVNVSRFNFTPDLVANLDIINRGQFTSLILTFIQINKILPSSLAVILSDNVIYVKDLTDSAQKPTPSEGLNAELDADSESKDKIQNFLEDVPFEEVLAKVIKTDRGRCIVAVNKDLVMTIADVFTNKGSTIETIVPSFMYGSNVNFTAGLTQGNMRSILGEAEILRRGNLLTDQQKINSLADLGTGQEKKEKSPKNLRQYLLLSVFVALLVILAVLYFNLGTSKTPMLSQGPAVKNPSVNTVSVPTTLPADGSALTQALITSAPLDLKSAKIKIVYSSQSDEKAVNLKSELLDIGFQDIVSEISEASTPEKSSIIFSQNIPTDLRNNIIAEVKKILPNISILENQVLDSTINILIGKS